MNDTAPHSALREWRAHMMVPARAASLLGAAAILALMGPFNTSDVMRALPRFAYWVSVVIGCYTVGYFGNVLGDRIIGARAGFVKRLAVAAPLTAVGVLAVVYVLTGLGIGFWATGRDLVLLAANVVAISGIITGIFLMIDQADAEQKPDTVPLMDRIPFEKRGDLVSLTVQDHYVNIVTTKGAEMILLRLADAIREVGGVQGLQVHRSHWIAVDGVRAATRKGDGAILTMSHGPDIPVSRANVAKLKEAGLLPR